jgi:hypothetical protein
MESQCQDGSIQSSVFSDVTPCSVVHKHSAAQRTRSQGGGGGGSVSGAVRETADNMWDCHW